MGFYKTVAVATEPGLWLSPLPGRTGDLDGDLAALRELGADVLVTLCPDHELQAHGVGDLPDASERHGLEHHHLPVPDFDVPPRDGLIELLGTLRAARALGRGVAVHCMAGRGRSGTVAACLLVEEGMSAAEALACVRAARPGALETPRQVALLDRWELRRSGP